MCTFKTFNMLCLTFDNKPKHGENEKVSVALFVSAIDSSCKVSCNFGSQQSAKEIYLIPKSEEWTISALALSYNMEIGKKFSLAAPKGER